MSTVVYSIRYYPYGEAIDVFDASEVGMYHGASAGRSDLAQPYLYGGKELERMHGLGEYDYGARRLQSHLPLWTTQDPCLEKYYSTGPYAYCAANPLRFIDPTGCVIAGATYLVENVKREAQSKIKAANRKAQQLQEDRKRAKNQKEYDKITTNIYKAQGEAVYYSNVLYEITKLEDSNQTYYIQDNRSINGSISTFGYNLRNGAFVINICVYGNKDIAHELKHAFQFEIGELDVAVEYDDNDDLYYDQTDEEAAYERGSRFTGTPTFFEKSNYPRIRQNTSYRSVMTDEKIKNMPPCQLLEYAAKHKRIFRYDGYTYDWIHNKKVIRNLKSK